MALFVRALLIMLICNLFATGADASDLFPISLKQRTDNSTLVTEGKVIAQESFWDARHQNIYTSNLVKVFRIFKGNIIGDEIEIITEGGTVGMEKHVFSSTLDLDVNQSGIFFCMPHQVKGFARTVNSGQSYMIYSSLQGFIVYDLQEKTAHDPFTKFASFGYAASAVKALTGMEKQIAINVDMLPGNNDMSNQTAATPIINSFSPLTIPAGTGAILTINGSGFGATQGTGFVEFRNSNDGGVSLEQPLASDYVSWDDIEIQVKVPSTVKDGSGCAGTGVVRVTNSDPATATSSSVLVIPYAYSNINDLETAAMPDHIADNGMAGGYTFRMENAFSTNFAANGAFRRAINSWTCNTGINWIIGAPTSADSVGADGINVVRFDIGSEIPAGILGRTTSRYSGCGSVRPLTWVVTEIDVNFNDVPTATRTWQFGPGAPTSNEYDFESVAVHELGHGHQLSHIVIPGAVMHYSIGNGQSSRTLSQADIDGANFIMARSIVANSCGPGPMLAGVCGTVPVKLISFDGSYQSKNNDALLTWKTTGETNISGYRVQRSKDGKNFTDVSLIKSNNSTQTNNYKYTDPGITAGKWFYRLSIVSADATEKLSPIILINAMSNSTFFTVYPNPARNEVIISGTNIDLNAARLDVLSAEGRKVKSQQFSERVNTFSKQISISQLDPGIYFYILYTKAGTTYTGKFTKEK